MITSYKARHAMTPQRVSASAVLCDRSETSGAAPGKPPSGGSIQTHAAKPGLATLAAAAGTWMTAVLGHANDPFSGLNTGLNVINTTINVVNFAQQASDQRWQAKAQAEIALAEYWDRRVEGYWSHGKQVVSRRLTYMYRKPSLAGPPIARWFVRDGTGRIVDRGTNILHTRLALRDTQCTNALNGGLWSTDQEGYLLMGMARVLAVGGHTVHNPTVSANSLEATVTGLRHLLNPTNACDGEITTESLPPKKLVLRFDQPVFFRLESTNTATVVRTQAAHSVVVVPRAVQNRFYDLPGTLLGGWNSSLGHPSPGEAQRLLARAQSVGRVPGALRDKATRAILALVSATYRDGLPEVQVMPAPLSSGGGVWDGYKEAPDEGSTE